jgi:hypothetical protein
MVWGKTKQLLAKFCCKIWFHLWLTSDLTLDYVLKLGSVNSSLMYLGTFASWICFYCLMHFKIIALALSLLYCTQNSCAFWFAWGSAGFAAVVLELLWTVVFLYPKCPVWMISYTSTLITHSFQLELFLFCFLLSWSRRPFGPSERVKTFHFLWNLHRHQPSSFQIRLLFLVGCPNTWATFTHIHVIVL